MPADIIPSSDDSDNIDSKAEKLRKYKRDWYLKNRKGILKKRRIYRETNKDDIKYRKHRHYQSNKEKIRQKHSAYYRKNRDKICSSNRTWRQNNREKMRIYNRIYRHMNKEKVHMQEFIYRYNNRDRLRNYMRLWHSSNPEKSKRIAIKYRQTHKEQAKERTNRRRARIANSVINDFTEKQWEEIKSAYDNHCVYCHRKMKKLTQDHITPLSKGGNHTASNIVPACRSCNSKKLTGPPLIPVQPLLLTISKSVVHKKQQAPRKNI